ncbi:MAG: hypothetical protein C7B46_19470 [Sulfobacillus benefaciens]|uniref:Uncharacterized protein n=1 Tax=Sulfobacillus benefaciens TaxID=453960 RepID=A0A2T2WYT6_9FIRM|nr:MAG: hypothetical protein C7B46_19470 [Sulfobacillus benefaciens]
MRRWLVAEELLSVNRTRGIRPPKITQTIPTALTPDFLTLLLAGMSDSVGNGLMSDANPLIGYGRR